MTLTALHANTRASGTTMTVAELRRCLEALPDETPLTVTAALWGQTELLAAELVGRELTLHVDATHTGELSSPLSWGDARRDSPVLMGAHPGADLWAVAVLTESLGIRAGSSDLYAVGFGVLNDLEEAGYTVRRKRKTRRAPRPAASTTELASTA